MRGKEADGILTLSCRAHSFYPRPITISWMKDGVVQDQETHWGGIVPNSDGTYHASATIDVPPGDWDKYQCRVEHASLLQSSFFSWGEPGSVGCVGLGARGPPLPFLTTPLSPRAAAQPDPHCGWGDHHRRGCRGCRRWIGGVEEQVRYRQRAVGRRWGGEADPLGSACALTRAQC